jgi:hypothetical protein
VPPKNALNPTLQVFGLACWLANSALTAHRRRGQHPPKISAAHRPANAGMIGTLKMAGRVNPLPDGFVSILRTFLCVPHKMIYMDTIWCHYQAHVSNMLPKKQKNTKYYGKLHYARQSHITPPHVVTHSRLGVRR